MSLRTFAVNSGKTSIAASITQVACYIATGSTVTAKVIDLACSFDSTATGAAAVPFRVELVRVTGASSGGSTYTPVALESGDTASNTTARINDTTDGASPTILYSWLVSPTSGIYVQYPLGREWQLKASDFLELRIISPSGITTCNYEASLTFQDS